MHKILIILIIHIIFSYDQNISLIFFMWKMDPMSGFDIRLVFTLPPRDSTLQYKRCVHLWNNFPCIATLVPATVIINVFPIYIFSFENWRLVDEGFLNHCTIYNDGYINGSHLKLRLKSGKGGKDLIFSLLS